MSPEENNTIETEEIITAESGCDRPAENEVVQTAEPDEITSAEKAAPETETVSKKTRRLRMPEWKNPFEDLGRPVTPERKRLREIFEVFSSHNFFVDGLTPAALRILLEDLGPTFVKIGQIMSSRPDILPKEYCEELGKLRSEVKPLEVSVVKEQILAEFGKPVEELFTSFEEEPLGSASIAQVHAAVLKDGRKVVAKVQRPNVAESMRMDFSMMKRMADLAADIRSDGTIAIRDVILELEKVTEDEIDFRVEAENTRKFRELCTDPENGIDCPQIIDELSGEHVMTMTYVGGYSIGHKDRMTEDGLDLNEIGQKLVGNYLDQIMDAGFFHGDPHQGNIMIEDGRIIWLDMGMMGRLNDTERQLVGDLLVTVSAQDIEGLKSVILDLGTAVGRIDHMQLSEDLESFVRRYGSAALDDLDLGKAMQEIMDLAEKHHVELPGWISMLARGLITIEGVVTDVCPDLNILGLLSEKMKSRVWKNFHLKDEAKDAMKSVTEAARKSVRIPSLAADALKNLNRGRTRVNIELSSYEGLMDRLDRIVGRFILAIFACTLLLASSLICMTDMQPKILGIPAVGLLGFIIAAALGIFVIIKMAQRGNEEK